MLNEKTKQILDVLIAENDTSDIFSYIRAKRKESEEKTLREAVEENRKYIGKCFRVKKKPIDGLFPEMYTYYKVINSRAVNQHNVSCLIFEEYPLYWFEYNSSLIGFMGDYYLGEYEFESFKTDNVLVQSLHLMEEISEDEFEQAMQTYVDRLKEMKWPADHYRSGEAKPGDEQWAVAKNFSF